MEPCLIASPLVSLYCRCEFDRHDDDNNRRMHHCSSSLAHVLGFDIFMLVRRMDACCAASQLHPRTYMYHYHVGTYAWCHLFLFCRFCNPTMTKTHAIVDRRNQSSDANNLLSFQSPLPPKARTGNTFHSLARLSLTGAMMHTSIIVRKYSIVYSWGSSVAITN